MALSGALTACATSDAPSTVDEAVASADVSTPTKITIKTDLPLALVAYRDVTDPVWHAADQKSPTKFVAKVHGPYWVTTVCLTDTDFGGGFILHQVEVTQLARVLGDGAELDPITCTKAPTTRDVSGTMAQAGHILVGDNFASSSSSPWTFQIPVLKGTYTLYASTADRIVFRRGLQVPRSLVIAPIDANVEGNLLAPVAFSVTNPDGVATRAVVRVEQQAGTFPGLVFAGSSAAALAIPNAVLTPDDNQTVSLQAPLDQLFFGLERLEQRSSRRPWQIGDDPSFTLPAQIGDATFFVNGNGDESVFWSSLPPTTVFSADVSGNSTSGNTIFQSADVSPAFLEAAFVPSLTLDTQIPGFLDDWRLDRTFGYSRDLIAQHLADTVNAEHAAIDTSTVSEFLDPTATPSPAPSARSAVAAPRSEAHPGRIAP